MYLISYIRKFHGRRDQARINKNFSFSSRTIHTPYSHDSTHGNPFCRAIVASARLVVDRQSIKMGVDQSSNASRKRGAVSFHPKSASSSAILGFDLKELYSSVDDNDLSQLMLRGGSKKCFASHWTDCPGARDSTSYFGSGDLLSLFSSNDKTIKFHTAKTLFYTYLENGRQASHTSKSRGPAGPLPWYWARRHHQV